MTTFFCLPTRDFSGREHEFTIATIPVLFNAYQDKILLKKWESTGKWQFLGGRYEDSLTFRDSASIHAKEVIGDAEIAWKDEEPIVFLDTIDLKGYEEKTLLVHYIATLETEANFPDTQWFWLDEILMLDAKNMTSSPNVRIVAEQFLRTTHVS